MIKFTLSKVLRFFYRLLSKIIYLLIPIISKILISLRINSRIINQLNRFYLGEFYKLSLTALCFAIIFFTLEVNFLALMFGFLMTLMSYRLALYMRLAF